MVDCSDGFGNQGCDGGWPSSALAFMKKNGMVTADIYPYKGHEDPPCKHLRGPHKVTKYIPVNYCEGLIKNIYQSPISVAVDATSWSSYQGGVLSKCGISINHAVVLVGVVDEKWIIKNSWGQEWGENGYIRLAKGSTCGLGLTQAYQITATKS